MLTHNDIAHLDIDSLARLWEAGKISHLVKDFKVDRSEDGRTRSVTYMAVDIAKLDASDGDSSTSDVDLIDLDAMLAADEFTFDVPPVR